MGISRLSLESSRSSNSTRRGSCSVEGDWDQSEDEFDQVHSPLLPISTRRGSSKESTPRSTTTKNNKSSLSAHRRHHRLAGLLKLATAFSLSLVVLMAVMVCGWAAWLIYTRHNAYAKSVFAPPLEPKPLPVEPLVPPFPSNDNLTSLENVQRQLDERLSSLSLPPSTLACDQLPSPSIDGNSTYADRFSNLPHSGPYLFALNLYNSQDVLPTLAKTLLTVSNFLGRSNVHVSIFENGSRDNTTLALAHLAAALSSLGVAHTIVSDSRSTDWKRVDRIDQLAVYRNVALSPVSRGINGRPFEDVLFINDVFAGPVDALELLWQRREQEADAACALDWRDTKGTLSKWGAGSVKMYDSWVARTITGGMLRARLDVLSEARNGVNELFDQRGEEPSRNRFKNGLPVPVYSCWNGMLALNAEPFRTSGTNPRLDDRIGPLPSPFSRPYSAAQTPALFRSALRSEGQCAASECKTLARDFWARGYNRWLVVPSVRVTYLQSTYTHPHLLELVDRARQYFLSTQSSSSPSTPLLRPKIEWSLPEWSAPKSVVCWRWARGFHIDIPGWRSTREKPYR